MSAKSLNNDTKKLIHDEIKISAKRCI